MVAKTSGEQQSSYWAQGGISAVLEPDDSIDQHTEDTIEAGAGLCDEAVVRLCADAGRENIEWLANLGMPFSRDRQDISNSGFHLTREGGHSRRRVVHAADATGKALQQTLQAHVLERENIRLFDQHVVIDLIHRQGKCVGLYALNREDQHVDLFRARKIILATGGAAKLYLICDPKDETEVEALEDYLLDQGLEVCLPAFDGDDADAAALHQENLMSCDAVLVYYGAAPKAWVDIKLRELLKAAGYGRETPITVQGVYIAPPDDRRKERFRSHQANVIHQSADFAPSAELDAFVDQIKEVCA